MNPNDKSLDILGIKPIGEAVNTVTKGSVEGASAFLSRVCLPVAEEYGLLLRDKVRYWRANNLANIAIEAERLLRSVNPENMGAHPRVAHEILEKGSWADDTTVQKMWAGLLAAACQEKQKGDSNIIFVNILNQLTSSQVRILNYSCENASKYISTAGFPSADQLSVDAQLLMKISGIEDLHQLDRELDCMRVLELIGSGGFAGTGGGFDSDTGVANLLPSTVALHLYTKAQGFLGDPIEYWDLKPKETKEPNKAVEPTIMAVTDAAAQPPRQP
jgi:Abortive infection alpha